MFCENCLPSIIVKLSRNSIRFQPTQSSFCSLAAVGSSRFPHRQRFASIRSLSSRNDGERSELHYTPLSRSVSGEDINGLNRIPYSADELQAGTAMLRRIVQDLKQQKGVTFILPLNDEDAMQLIIQPFRKLIEEGIRPEFLLDACVQCPQLLSALARRGQLTYDLTETLVDQCAMTFEDAIRLFATYTDELLSVDVETMRKRLSVLIGCNISAGVPLGRVVRKCPAVLFASQPKPMAIIAESLSAFFSRSQISMMVTNTPHILLGSMDELEPKYEYIYYHMCMDESEFGDCKRWVDMPLEEIIMRHEFLQKTGKYASPDPKRPQFKMENPLLKQILDTPDAYFANQIAGVSQEEWIVYKGLCDKLEQQSDKEKPFERIKPSQRKAFERRRKASADVQKSHVFDETPDSD